MTPEQKAAVDAMNSYGSQRKAAESLGISRGALRSRIEGAKKYQDADPAVKGAMSEVGMQDAGVLHSGWIKTDGASLYFQMPKGEGSVDFITSINECLEDYKPLDKKLFAPRINSGEKGDKLLVLDLADVHFGKLCVDSETNHNYNVEICRHRVIEGTKQILRRADGVGRILFVMGNDILHTDNGKSTTSGTPQDTDGTYFTAWRAAQHSSIDAILECSAIADVDLIHCMSNHDWRSGWALSQTIAASLKNHNGVRATPYNISERHRKYYGYGRNGLMLTHGDGAKEADLTSLFLREAKNMISKCDLLYSYLHHFHHKLRKRKGIDVFMSEKDHTAFTQINMGATRVEGGDMMAEYVRSPSAPDGWHDRQGYINRQAVEAFSHCPHDGQKDRYTEWF